MNPLYWSTAQLALAYVALLATALWAGWAMFHPLNPDAMAEEDPR